MDKNNRLQLLRARANIRLPLSESAAETLESIKRDDPDLGGEDVGVIFEADDVRKDDSARVEDESEVNTELISPLMREAVECLPQS